MRLNKSKSGIKNGAEGVLKVVLLSFLVTKSDSANFVKNTDFDNKLKNLTSNKNEFNELSKKVEIISTKGLTNDLVNKFSILYGEKHFSSGIFQNY